MLKMTYFDQQQILKQSLYFQTPPYKSPRLSVRLSTLLSLKRMSYKALYPRPTQPQKKNPQIFQDTSVLTANSRQFLFYFLNRLGMCSVE